MEKKILTIGLLVVACIVGLYAVTNKFDSNRNMMKMIEFIEDNTDLEYKGDKLPTVEIATQQEMCEVLFDVVPEECNIAGYYNDETNVIVIGTGLINLSITFEKKTLQVMYMFFLSAIINIILNYSLIPKYGVFGAVYATLFSSAIYFCLNYWYSRKCYFIPIDWKRFIFLLTLFTAIVLIFQLITLQWYYIFGIKLFLVIVLLFLFKNKYFSSLKKRLIV